MFSPYLVNLLLGYTVPYVYLKRFRGAPLGFSPTGIHSVAAATVFLRFLVSIWFANIGSELTDIIVGLPIS